MIFEILCLGDGENVKSRTVKTLLYALMANDRLLNNCDVHVDKGELRENSLGLRLTVNQFPTDEMLTADRDSLAYRICVDCENLEVLDAFRTQLVEYIKKIGFSHIRIMIDEVSETLANSIYSHLYKLENKVRTFVTNFFLKNLGTNWTRLAMSAETLKKISERRNNDRVFIKAGKVEGDVMLIDFDDLGRILHSEKSFLTNKKPDNVSALIEKIQSATDLDTLKSEVLEGNFNKYFKDCFVRKDFESKWFDLYYYRNKVAHNGYFSKSEVEECLNLCAEVAAIIDTAYEKLDTFKLSRSDKEAVIDAVAEISFVIPESNEENNSRYTAIDKETFLSELREAEKRLPYVGLRHFVVEWLGVKGYDYNASYMLLNYLADDGVLRINKRVDPKLDYPISVISIA